MLIKLDKILTVESNNDQKDDRYRRYKLEETTVPANKIENCSDGYFLDGKSRRCVGTNYHVRFYVANRFFFRNNFTSSVKDRFQNNLLVADVDECANGLAVCGIGERCVNTEGGYRCSPTCAPGFRLRNNSRLETEESCDDINECLLGLHTCNARTHYCVNTNGSYACEALTTTTTTTTTTPRIISRRPFVSSRYNNKVQVPRSSPVSGLLLFLRTLFLQHKSCKKLS